MTPSPDQPYDGVQRVELESVPLAAIRYADATLADLPRLFDGGFRTLGGLAATGALAPTGPALAVYHGDPMGTFDLEIAFPVAEAPGAPLGDEGQVSASALPAGPAAATTHLGPYDGLGESWAALVAGAGAEPAGVWIEVYVTDPSGTDPLRTDLLMPLRA